VPMKYLAILKDSLREAIDTKIFYVTVALSVLISLLVMTITYKPVPTKDMVDTFTDVINLIAGSKHRDAPKMNLDPVKEVTIQEFQRLDSGEEPWTGSYRFVMQIELWEPMTEGKPAEVPPPPGGAQGGAPPGGPPNPLKQDAPNQEDGKHDGGKHDGGKHDGKQDGKHQVKGKLSPRVTENSLLIPLMMFYQWFDQFSVKQLPPADDKHQRFEVTTKGMKRGFRSRQEWFHRPGLAFGLVEVPLPYFNLSQIVSFIGNTVIGNLGGAVTMLLSIVITSFFIPSMMSKGTVDLLLVKPINRYVLFIFKFLGGMTFMLLNTTIIMFGVWFGLGIQSGFWCHSFLLCIPVFTFEFVIFYAASAFSGVVTRSPIVSILSVVLLWGMLSLAGWAYWIGVESYAVQNRPSAEVDVEPAPLRPPPEGWGIDVIKIMHGILPRYKDLDWLLARQIRADLLRPREDNRQLQENYEFRLKALERDYGAYSWAESVAISTLFIGVFVGLASWRFAARDY
jgi:ABC-type transport system involved in multi-copper enzyme maturation permease subunit